MNEDQELNVIVDKSKTGTENKAGEKNFLDKMKQGLKKQTARKRFVLAICAVLLCTGTVVVVHRLTRNRLDPADYIQISYTGANGYAQVHCNVEEDKLYQALAGKEKDMEKLTAFRRLAESLRAEVPARDIQNGDRLTVQVTYDSEAAKAAGIKVTRDEYKVKASGIGNGTRIDLFSQLEVIFAGISPEAYVVINNRWEDDYLKGLSFTADKSGGIRAGDTVTVSCAADMQELARHGYIAETFSASYTADRLSSYVSGTQQLNPAVLKTISDEAVSAIAAQTADTTFRMLYRATGDPAYLRTVNSETAEHIQLMEKFFLTRKNASEGSNENYLYLIYRADIMNADDSVEVFFAFEYSQGYMTVDGNFDIAHDEPEKRYTCSDSYETLYESVIGEKESLYDINHIK